jgi:hypothetical protein
MHDEEHEAVLEQIASLKQEHRDLDHAIARLEENLHLDELQIRRLKKRKLALKDQIDYLERILIPDLPA